MDRTGYNKYNDFAELSYNCISYMMDNSEIIWKLLKYPTPDAWDKANLTSSEKAALIYNGQQDATDTRVFMDVGQSDVWTEQDCLVRIAPYTIIPENRTVGTISMMFEVYAHYKINHLSNYKTRIDMISQEMLNIFNGAIVGGIGRLFFDRLGSLNAKAAEGGAVPYKGRWILMSNKSG